MAEDKKAENALAPVPDIETPEGRREVFRRAAAGDTTVEPLVTKFLDRDLRNGGDFVEKYGNTFSDVVRALTKTAAGKDVMMQGCLLRKIEAVRDELAGPNPTPLERILCERVALCWFDANEMDRRFVDQSEISFKTAQYRESRRDRAHRRFLAACKTLATVRRLGVPNVQINQVVARQQVNVAGST